MTVPENEQQQLLVEEISSLSLERHPPAKDKSLRAWNAADELIIEHLTEYLSDAPNKNSNNESKVNCLIVNDQFGALSASLNELSPFYWTDSILSHKAILANLNKNFQQNTRAQAIRPTLQTLDDNQIRCQLHQPIKFDLVVIRIPKHNSLLEFQLRQISGWINQETKIIAGGMTKDIHKSNIKLFESILGMTTTSLAKKKARLIFSRLEKQVCSNSEFKQYDLAEQKIVTCGLPGVFSRDSLDIGTRVLLNHLPDISENQKIIDLGCGNGVVGAIVAARYATSELTLTDESYLAVESARLTFATNRLTNGKFVQTDSLDGVQVNSFDYVLCNPPFHQQNVQTLDIAAKMFRQSAICLKRSGELRVVANRHLKYHSLLKKYFNQVESISHDSKFTVWLAKSPKINKPPNC